PWAITSAIRGRRTAHLGTFGAVIFDARIGSSSEAAGRLGLITTCLAAWVAMETSAAAPAGPSGPATSGYLTRTTNEHQTMGDPIILFRRSPGLLKKPPALPRSPQRRIDVAPKRDRHLRGGESTPAEPGHGSDPKQDSGVLLVGGARRY